MIKENNRIDRKNEKCPTLSFNYMRRKKINEFLINSIRILL